MNQDNDQFELEIRYCHEAISQLRKSYDEAIKPYMNRLICIESLRAPRYVVPRESYEAIMSASQKLQNEDDSNQMQT